MLEKTGGSGAASGAASGSGSGSGRFDVRSSLSVTDSVISTTSSSGDAQVSFTLLTTRFTCLVHRLSLIHSCMLSLQLPVCTDYIRLSLDLLC